MKTLVLAFSFLILTLSPLGLSPATAQSEKTHNAATEALFDADRSFSAYSVKHGFKEAFAAYISDDMVKLDGGRAPTIGRDAVLNSMRSKRKGLSIYWEPSDGSVAASGELGYTWGIATFERTAEDGTVSKNYGKYMNVWRKSDEGKWQVILDGGNSLPKSWPNVE